MDTTKERISTAGKVPMLFERCLPEPGPIVVNNALALHVALVRCFLHTWFKPAPIDDDHPRKLPD